MTEPDHATAASNGEFWRGLAVGLGTNALFGLALPLLALSVFGNVDALGLLGVLGGLVAFGIGLSQWLWLVPMIRKARGQKEDARAKGLLVAGAITVLLNGACFGSIALMDFNVH